MALILLWPAGTRSASVSRGRFPCSRVGMAQRGVRAMTRTTRSGPMRRSRPVQSFSVNPGSPVRMTMLGR